MRQIRLPFVARLAERLDEPRPLIQVILGPRQVGKTTGCRQYLQGRNPRDYLYASADGALPKPPTWLLEQWVSAKSHRKKLLVIDEIQNVEGWAGELKRLWDEQVSDDRPLGVVLLGSSSLSIQNGLRESLAGRYWVHHVFHWSYAESAAAYDLSFDQFLLYGGYPGAYRFVERPLELLAYVRESIIDAVIGKDILSLVRVKSPALFKQCFDLATVYGAQELSYTKMLGQLQDRGNTDLVKHYLEHFQGAFLLAQLFKFTNKPVLTRTSSPKLLPLCPVLYTQHMDFQLNGEQLGRAFEVVVGQALWRLPGKLQYWRRGNREVDYVYQFGRRLLAIEVKFGHNKGAKGLAAFKKEFPEAELLLLTPDNYQDVIRELEAG